MRGSRVAMLAVAAVLSLPGCIFDPDKEPGDPEDLLKTPSGVVVQLADAYRNMDIDRYLACFVDTFEYHLVPRDVNDVWPAPSWGKVEEERFHRHMFDTMDHIELTLVGDYAARIADDPETWRLYREFDLLVWETATELLEEGVGYGWLEFVVQKQSDGRFRMTDCYELEQEP
jgi:hypothetical protein